MKVALLLVDMPQVDILNRAELPESETISAIFRSAASKYPHVMYLDLKRVYEHRHEVFYDMIHMNAAGQALVTENIATSIKARSKNYRRLVSDSITQKIKSRIFFLIAAIKGARFILTSVALNSSFYFLYILLNDYILYFFVS